MESFVLLVNDENYDRFIKENEQMPIVLAFTTKKQTPAILKSLSKDYKGKLVFGEVRDTSRKLVEKYQITQFPTMLMVTDSELGTGIKYDNEMRKDSIKLFLREFAVAQDKSKKKTTASGSLKELTASVIKAGSCGSTDNVICFLTLVNIKENNKELLNMLGKVAANYPDDPIKFYYANHQNLEYLNTFDDVINEFPKLFILKPKRKRYTEYNGVFEEQKVKDFVDMVMSGSGEFKKMRGDLIEAEHPYNEDL